ncbi:hypothetical protein ACU4GR_25895 [Methylobacterium oryzae CBMB20]
MLRDLAAKLQAGRLFGSGRAFVPFVKAALFDRLLAVAGIPAAPRPAKAAAKPAEAGGIRGGGHGRGACGSGAGEPPATRAGAKAPPGWSQIGIGSRVLAEDEAEGGYYSAKVIATKVDNHFQFEGAGYPDLPEFSRARRALALLHPEMSGAAQ